MRALLHYAYLKGMRDRSLPVFLLIPAAQFFAMITAFSGTTGHLRYPLKALNFDHGDLAAMSILLPSVVATMSAFWTFRSELATGAIGSFVIASRPIVVIAALVVFAAATGTGGIFGAVGTIALLTAEFPARLVSMIGTGAMAALSGAALGALYVTISPQPQMLVWSFIAGIPFVPFIFDPANWHRLPPIGLLLAIICIAVSTFLLRRRCAT